MFRSFETISWLNVIKYIKDWSDLNWSANIKYKRSIVGVPTILK